MVRLSSSTSIIYSVNTLVLKIASASTQMVHFTPKVIYYYIFGFIVDYGEHRNIQMQMLISQFVHLHGKTEKMEMSSDHRCIESIKGRFYGFHSGL